MYYDSHTHLNQEDMFPRRKEYVDTFIQAGGKGLINSGASEFYNLKAIEIAQANKDNKQLIVKASLGRHPLECVSNDVTSENLSAKMDQLKSRCKEYAQYNVAIGEAGIDLHYPWGTETLQLQKELFAKQCDLAQELDLPIVIHSRDAYQDTLDILQNYKNLTIYFHCWGYGPLEYKQLDSLFPNLFIGFCGNVTYKKAQDLRDTLAIVRDSQLLLETDAPYLSPEGLRGTTNHPANISHLYDFVAQQKNLSLPALQTLIETNFKKVYGL